MTASMPASTVPDAAESSPGGRRETALVERHRGWLSRLVASRIGRGDSVDDVMQEVALAVARSQKTPEGECDERPWLCAIAIRQCALFLRSSYRRGRLLSRAADQLPHAVCDRLQEDPIYWLMGREDAGLVARALAALDDADRQVLAWKYVDGQSYPQVAARLGVPRHVAEYRVVTAKKRLRSLLVDIGMGEEESR